MAEQRAVYKAIADFSQLDRAARRAKRSLKELDAEANKVEKNYDRSQTRMAASQAKVTEEQVRAKKASQELRRERQTMLGTLARLKREEDEQRAVIQRSRREYETQRRSLRQLDTEFQRLRTTQEAHRRSTAETSRDNDAFSRSVAAGGRAIAAAGSAAARATPAIRRQGSVTRETSRDSDKMSESFQKLEERVTSLGGAFGGAGRRARDLSVVLSIIKLPAIIAGVHLLTGGVLALAGALTALTTRVVDAVAALGSLIPRLVQMAGIMGGLPQVIVGFATAFGAVMLGTRGIGDALKAMGEVETETAREAIDSAERRVEAIEAVSDAQESLSDSITAVEDAEFNLEEAHFRVTRAQEDLNEAIRDAVENLEDLELAARGAILSERSAELRLLEARQRLAELSFSGDFDFVAYQGAVLAVQQAELGVAEARDASQDAQYELNKAQKEGVNGSRSVVDAQRSLEHAVRAVADAQESLRDSHEGVSDAMYALTKAQKEHTEALEGTTGETDKLAEAMENLPPAARAFVRQLYSMKPLLETLKRTAAEGLLPGVSAGLKAMIPLFPVVNEGIGDMARILGNLAHGLGSAFGSALWRRDLKLIMDSNEVAMLNMSDAVLNFTDALRNVMVAARPVVEWVSQLIEAWSLQARAAAEAGRETGRLQEYFEGAMQAARQLGRIFGNLWGWLRAVGQASSRTGQMMWDAFERATAGWEQWAESAEGQQRITAYFERSREALYQLGRVLANLWGVLEGVGRGTRDWGIDLWNRIEGATARWEEFVKSVEGQDAIRRWVEASKAPMSEMNLLVRDVAKGFVNMGMESSGAFTSLIAKVRRDLLPVVWDLFTTIDEQLAPALVDLAVNAIKLFAVFGKQGGFAALGGIAVNFLRVLNGALSLFNALIRVPIAGFFLNALWALTGLVAGFRVLTAFALPALVSGIRSVVTWGKVMIGWLQGLRVQMRLGQMDAAMAGQSFGKVAMGMTLAREAASKLAMAMKVIIPLLIVATIFEAARAFFEVGKAVSDAREHVEDLRESLRQTTSATGVKGFQKLRDEMKQVEDDTLSLMKKQEAHNKSQNSAWDSLGNAIREVMPWWDSYGEAAAKNQEDAAGLARTLDQELVVALNHTAGSTHETVGRLTEFSKALVYSDSLTDAQRFNASALVGTYTQLNDGLGGLSLGYAQSFFEQGRFQRGMAVLRTDLREVTQEFVSLNPEVAQLAEAVGVTSEAFAVDLAAAFGTSQHAVTQFVNETRASIHEWSISQAQNFDYAASAWQEFADAQKVTAEEVKASLEEHSARLDRFRSAVRIVMDSAGRNAGALRQQLLELGPDAVGVVELIHSSSKQELRGFANETARGEDAAQGFAQLLERTLLKAFFKIINAQNEIAGLPPLKWREWINPGEARRAAGVAASALQDGIGPAAEGVRDDVVEAISGIEAGVRGVLQARSPSRVMSRIGRDVARGFIQGVIRGLEGSSDKMTDRIREAWEKLLPFFTRTFRSLRGSFVKSFDEYFRVIEKVWSDVLTDTVRVWDRILDKVEGALDQLRTAFRQAKDAIGSIWDQVKTEVEIPVKFVVNRILGDGIVPAFNKVLAYLNLDKIAPIAYAAGGRVPGIGNRDTVPAMLTPGEWVIRKEAADELGPETLRRINQLGGSGGVQYRHAGGPILPGAGGIVKLGHAIMEEFKPYFIGEHPHWSGPGPGHIYNSQHFWPMPSAGPSPPLVGRALDISFAPGVSDAEKGQLNALAAWIMRVVPSNLFPEGGPIYPATGDPAHQDHLHISVSEGPGIESIPGFLGSAPDLLKKAFEKVRDMLGEIPGDAAGGRFGQALRGLPRMVMQEAVAFAKEAERAMWPAGGRFGAAAGGSEDIREIVRSTAAKFGWNSGNQWAALTQLIAAESSWNPTAQNPTSTAFGLFQFLDSTWAGTGISKTSDPALQTLAGLRYIQARYGTPAGAWAFHQANNWYGKGGPVPGLLSPGEYVLNDDAAGAIGPRRLDWLNNLGQGLQPQKFHSGGPVGDISVRRSPTFPDEESDGFAAASPTDVRLEIDGRTVSQTVRLHGREARILMAGRSRG